MHAPSPNRGATTAKIPDAATTARIDELRQVVERMGEINLTALEEYEERAKRHDDLVV